MARVRNLVKIPVYQAFESHAHRRKSVEKSVLFFVYCIRFLVRHFLCRCAVRVTLFT